MVYRDGRPEFTASYRLGVVPEGDPSTGASGIGTRLTLRDCDRLVNWRELFDNRARLLLELEEDEGKLPFVVSALDGRTNNAELTVTGSLLLDSKRRRRPSA